MKIRAGNSAALFLDPNKLLEVPPAEVLEAAAGGRLGIDHRFLHALIDRREEALPAVIRFSTRERAEDRVDLAPELIALFRYWKTPEAVPFILKYVAEDPRDIPDEAVEALVEIGEPALEPLLKLYSELDESDSGEIAFVLANLRVHDNRILQMLTGRMEYDLSDAAFLLGIYGDPAAIPNLEQALAELSDAESDARADVQEALDTLRKSSPGREAEQRPPEPFDIWSLYDEERDPDIEWLDEDERVELLDHPLDSLRLAAVSSFFNQELTDREIEKLLRIAQTDHDANIRGRAWEALINATEKTEVLDAMLAALRKKEMPVEERGGLLVGLASEADRNEVRREIESLYRSPEARAKALEAMWRSVHPSFRDYFAKHLEDADTNVRRAAIWGVGYYGVRGELDQLRRLFSDEELRADALFAYALALPSDISRGRVRGLLARIEKDAHGLSEMEEELVKTALDERLMLAGKEPVFSQEED